MKLEQVTQETIHELSDEELHNLRERANQLSAATENWALILEKRMVGVSQPIGHQRFAEIYTTICAELEKRELTWRKTNLDRRLIKRRIRGVDVSDLPPMMVRSAVVAITGPFVANPRRADSVTVFVNADEFGDLSVPAELEKRMAELLADQTDKPVQVTRKAEDLVAPAIVVYDLVLVPRPTTEDLNDVSGVVKAIEEKDSEPYWANGVPTKAEVADAAAELIRQEDEEIMGSLEINLTDISKPYPNEHAARQLPPGGFDRIRRVNDHFGSGIHALFGVKGGKSKVQSVRFSATKFTVAEAKAWLKEHDMKTGVIAATGKTKKTEVGFIKNEEQHLVGGVVYPLDETDLQGDFVDEARELWGALESFMLKGGRVKVMHKGRPVHCPVIENFQAETDTVKGGDVIPAGAWYMTCKILDSPAWAAIKSGEITGFSMAGKARGEPVD